MATLEHPDPEATGSLALESEHENQNRPARNARMGSSSVVRPGEYRDDRNSEIIHSGIIGTVKGRTGFPKRTMHKNALDYLTYPYDEDEGFFMLHVNLGGDQIDELIHDSEVYQARGGYRN